MSGAPGLLLSRRYQVAVAGSNVPGPGARSVWAGVMAPLVGGAVDEVEGVARGAELGVVLRGGVDEPAGPAGPRVDGDVGAAGAAAVGEHVGGFAEHAGPQVDRRRAAAAERDVDGAADDQPL